MMRRPAVMLAIVAMVAAVWLQQRVDTGRHAESQSQTQSKQQSVAQPRSAPQEQPRSRSRPAWPSAPTRVPQANAAGSIDAAVARHLHDVSVQGSGRVLRVLPNDTQGSPHQRFLLRLASGATVLIAHNTELAPRLEALHEGDTVEFSGEYVWNPKGGVVHWTHHDPAGRHAAGWLRHAGQVSQ